jgi:hypothetical protein
VADDLVTLVDEQARRGEAKAIAGSGDEYPRHDEAPLEMA